MRLAKLVLVISASVPLSKSAKSSLYRVRSVLPTMLDCPPSKNMGSSCVSTATVLAAEPALLLTTTEYLALWSAANVAGIVNVADVAPAMGVPLRRHS